VEVDYLKVNNGGESAFIEGGVSENNTCRTEDAENPKKSRPKTLDVHEEDHLKGKSGSADLL
jgi:hypothetical protein